MKFLAKQFGHFYEMTKPYIDDIDEPTLANVARMALPVITMMMAVWIISMPFGVITALIDAAVKITTYRP